MSKKDGVVKILKERISFSTYLFDIKQIQPGMIPYFNNIEIVIFDEIDAKKSRKDLLQAVTSIIEKVKPLEVSFHYSMNNCEYWKNKVERLYLIRICDVLNELNVNRLVLHSNFIRSISDIDLTKFEEIRQKIIDTLLFIKKLYPQIDISLENMTVLGVMLDDADPLFLTADDFDLLKNTDLSITFDFCHFWTNEFIMKNDLLRHVKDINYKYYDYLHKKDFSLKSFNNITKHINHIHISSFQYKDNRIIEGKVLSDGIVPRTKIESDILFMKKNNQNNLIYNFEISEENYHERKAIYRMVDDFKKIAPPVSE